jgi:hypothetical protein
VQYWINTYFGTDSYFVPPHGSGAREAQQPQDFFPFKSKLESLLYIFCNSDTIRFSRAQLIMVWWILREVNPNIRIPSIESIMKLRLRMPRPRINKFYIMGSQAPYYLISINDLIRLVFGIPGHVLNELPEVATNRFGSIMS